MAPRHHPVDVAAQRVDLAVMGEIAERMRQLPGREGIGREARMHQRQRGFRALVLEVLVEAGEPLGDHHALVDDGARRAARDIEGGALGQRAGADRLVALLADDEELALERVGIGAIGAAGDEELADHRRDRLDALAQHRGVARHVAPAQQRLPLGGDEMPRSSPRRPGASRHGAAGTPCRRHSGRAPAGEAQRRRLRAQQPVGELDQDPGAVARQRVGAHRAAMGEIVEDLDAVDEDAMALAVLDIAR